MKALSTRCFVMSALLPLLMIVVQCLFFSSSTFAQVAAGFDVDTRQGCAPINITCRSTENDGVINWQWRATNGQTFTTPNAKFTFTKPGRYRIKLVVSDNSSSDSATRDIIVNGIPTEFSYQYNDICTVPVPVQFQSYDTLVDGNYRWDFGDTAVSISPNPMHTYQTQGTFTVKLITYSTEGCIDSLSKIIQTGRVRVDFTAPEKTCSNTPVQFSSISTSEPKFAVWTIDGVEVSRSTSGFSKSFPIPGTYTVRLTENFGGCTFQNEKQIVVLRKPQASYETDGIVKSCAFPSTVRFLNSSQGADRYEWSFGDNAKSTDANPTHRYDTAGQFSPRLIATNANGCADTLVKTGLVLLGPPTISGFAGLPASRCLPYTIEPQVQVITPEPIVTFHWDFGDGATSADSIPKHIYTVTGYYDVSLYIETVNGCKDTFLMQKAVSVGDSIIPDFTVDKLSACASDTFSFSGTASGVVPANVWSWRFGDGTTAGGQNVKHVFSSIGKQTVSLEVNNNGCRVRTYKKDLVTAKPPISKIKLQYDCQSQLKVNFTDGSQGPASWEWDFGDNSPLYTGQNPMVHEYPASGFYIAKLKTTNNECSSIDTVTVSVLSSKPVFTFDPADGFICRKSGLWMSSTYPEFIDDYYWDFDDLKSTFSDTAIYHHYNDAGIYHPSLVVKYLNGCYDTLYSPTPVTVTGPTASYSSSQPTWCRKDDVVFTDSSRSDGKHDIVKWEWDCGDGFTDTRPSPLFSHVYLESGSFDSRLIVTDNNRSCTDTAYYTVVVNGLPDVSAGLDTFNCEGSTVQLQASGAASYVWDANQTLSCTDCPSPLASPVQQALYVVTGTDNNQCKNTDTVSVQVIHPFTLSVMSQSVDICQNGSVTLQASGADLYSWIQPEGLSNPGIANPVASPAQTTTYTVIGTDSHFCFQDSMPVTVNVYPIPQFDIVDTALYLTKGSAKLLTTSGSPDVVSWMWTPSAGLNCVSCAQPEVTAGGKDVTYYATATTEHGCSFTDNITVHVLCNNQRIVLPTGFTPNGDGKNDWFYVLSDVNNPIVSFSIFSRNGERVYQKKNGQCNVASDGWDGMYNGYRASPGVYVYRVEVKCNEEVIQLTGTITLLR